MKAVNLTTTPVELDPVNGPGMLAPATEDSGGAHERELAEVTDRERALAAAGVIALEGDVTLDRFDKMDRQAVDAALADAELTATRADGREDLEPTLNDKRRALRAAEAGGDSA